MATPSITLPKDLREDIFRDKIERVRQCTQASRVRNDWMTDCEQQVNGRGYAATTQTQGNASLIEDPLTQEQMLTVLASCIAPYRQGDKPLQLEAINPDDEEAATQAEGWLNIKLYEWRFLDTIYDVFYNACVFPVSWLYACWKQEYTTEYSTVWLDKKGKPVAESMLTGEETEEPQLTEAVKYEGVEYRAPDPRDIYLDPPNAQDAQQATGVFERLLYTAHDLLNGVSTYGFDMKAVRTMLEAGATSQSGADWRQDQDDRDGAVEDKATYWECYRYIGKLPVLMGAESNFRVPVQLWNVDFEWLICPRVAGGTIFKFEVWNEGMRPYVPFNLYRKGGRLQGESVATLLKPIQEEATVSARYMDNSYKWSTTPGWFVDKSQERDFGKYAKYPGCSIPVDQAGGLVPTTMPVDMTGLQAGMEYLGWLQSRGSALMSGHSLNLQPKVRKTGEVQADQQNIAMKFDLFSDCLARGIEQAGVLSMTIAAPHIASDGETAGNSLSPFTVTPQDLRRKYRYVANASSGNTNPMARLQRWTAIMQAVMSSPIFALSVQSGDYSMAWNLLRRFIEANQERNVVSIIGPEPPHGPDPQFVMQQASQGIMKLIQWCQQVAQHDPLAGAIAQQLQQIVQKAMQAGQQAQAAQQQGGGGALAGVAPNPKAALPIQEGPAGFAQAGLPQMNGAGV